MTGETPFGESRGDRSFVVDSLCQYYPEDPAKWDAIEQIQNKTINPLTHPRIIEAREICGRCPVRAACLAYAIENEEYGVWGGEYLVKGKIAQRCGRKAKTTEKVAA